MDDRCPNDAGQRRDAPGRTARLWLLLGALLALAAFGAQPAGGQEEAVGTRTPRPSVTPTPGCVATARHWAEPERLRPGEATTATLHVLVACPPPPPEPLHVVLVLDITSAMSEEMVIAELRGAGQLVRDLRLGEVTTTRSGVVAFSEYDRQRCALTSDEDRLLTCLRLARGLQDARRIGRARWALDQALLEGHRMLRAGRAGLEPARIREILVLFSVGPPERGCGPLLKAARTVRSDHILLMTVCVAAKCNAECMRAVASSPRYFFQIDNAGGLAQAFFKIRDDRLLPLSLYYDLSPGVRYVPDSAVPPATVAQDGGRLTWGQPYAPADGVTVTLRLVPPHAGRQPLAREAGATWYDILGYPARVVAPTAEVEVEAAP